MLLTANPNRITSTAGHLESVLMHYSPCTFKKQTNQQNSDGCEQDRCPSRGERNVLKLKNKQRSLRQFPQRLFGRPCGCIHDLSNLRPANRVAGGGGKSRRGERSSSDLRASHLEPELAMTAANIEAPEAATLRNFGSEINEFVALL